MGRVALAVGLAFALVVGAARPALAGTTGYANTTLDSSCGAFTGLTYNSGTVAGQTGGHCFRTSAGDWIANDAFNGTAHSFHTGVTFTATAQIYRSAGSATVSLRACTLATANPCNSATICTLTPSTNTSTWATATCTAAYSGASGWYFDLYCDMSCNVSSVVVSVEWDDPEPTPTPGPSATPEPTAAPVGGDVTIVAIGPDVADKLGIWYMTQVAFMVVAVVIGGAAALTHLTRRGS